MHPELLKTPFFSIHTYGFFIVLGFLLCLYLIRKKTKAEGLNPDKMTDVAFWSLLFGLLGGRLLYVITLWREFAQAPLEIFRFWNGGLVYFGGFITGILSFIYLCKRYEIPILRALDIATPSLAIAHSFGRLGCFAAGCCYGKPTDPSHWYAVIFTHPDTIAPTGIALHPTQLYDSVNALLLFLVLNWLYHRKKFDGQVILMYGMLYSIGRSVIETFRGDKVRGFLIQDVLSTSQFISIFIFLISVFFYFKFRRNAYPSNKQS